MESADVYFMEIDLQSVLCSVSDFIRVVVN